MLASRNNFNIGTPMPYMEFQTKLLKVFERVNSRKISTKASFAELATTSTLFHDNGDNLVLRVNWLHHDGDQELLIYAIPELDEEEQDVGYTFQFYSGDRHILTISYDHDNEIKVQQHHSSGNGVQWNNIDISNLVDEFNQVFHAKRINFISKKMKDEVCVEIRKNDITCFSKEEFDQFIHQYQDYNLTYRINNVILQNSSKRGNNYTFKLMWPDSMDHCRQLKVTFSRADLFEENYSWFVNEKILLKSIPEYSQEGLKTGQYYYSLKINEVMDETETSSKHEAELLCLWLTVDGLVGELRDLEKSSHFSGNDILNIYLYFAQLLKVKNDFLCDESKLMSDDRSIRVPLRLISAIATGKTWYENKIPGLTLFECHKFETKANGVITQNRAARSKALQELQKLPLRDWHKMLDEQQREVLASLYKSVTSDNSVFLRRSTRLLAKKGGNAKINFADMTIQDFTTKIYNDAKASKAITPALARLVELLCDGISLLADNNSLRPSMSDYWVKSRVRELLWGSYFWVKKSEQQNELEEGKQCKY